MTIYGFDLNNPAVPSQITSMTAPTSITTHSTVASVRLNPEEAGGGVYTDVLFSEDIARQPLVVREGQGVAVQQYGTAGVGTVDVSIWFRVY